MQSLSFEKIIAGVLVLLLIPWTCDGIRVYRQGVESAVAKGASCFTEWQIAHGMEQVGAGRELYPVVSRAPQPMHFYNPLTYWAGLFAAWLDWDIFDMLLAGRGLALASAIVVLLLLAGYVSWQSRQLRWGAVTAAMVLYFHSSTLTDFYRCRPEMPALALTVAGWVVVQRQCRHWTAWAALLFVAAIGFKPTFVAAPIACVIQLAIAKDYKSLARLGGAAAGISGGLLALAYFYFGRGYWSHTLGAMTACPVDPIAGSWKFYPILVLVHWKMLFPTALCCVGWLIYKQQQRPLLIYLGMCLILTTLTHGKQGADLNYHGELSLLVVLTTACGIVSMQQQRSRLVWLPLCLLVAGTWVPVVQYGWSWNQLSHTRLLHGPFAYAGPPSLEFDEAVVQQLSGERALILNDELAVRAGKAIILDWFAVRILLDAGYFDLEPICQAIEQKRFHRVMIPSTATDVWTEQLRRAARAGGFQRSPSAVNDLEDWVLSGRTEFLCDGRSQDFSPANGDETEVLERFEIMWDDEWPMAGEGLRYSIVD